MEKIEMKGNTGRVGVLATLVAVAIGATAFAAEPIHKWSFDAMDVAGRRAKDEGVARKKAALVVKDVRTGQGIGCSAALWVGSGKETQLPYFKIDLKEFTLDMKFRLDEDVAKKGNALFHYANKSGRGSRVLFSITGDRRLRVEFVRVASKDGKRPPVEWVVQSEPLAVAAGKYHSVRFACDGNGVMSIYYDGGLVARKGECPSFAGILLDEKPSNYYPLLRIGHNDDWVEKPSQFFNGCFDDIAIYDVALGAPEIEIPSGDYSEVSNPEYSPASEGSVKIVVLKGGVGGTGKFEVKDKVGTGFNGLLLGAVEKAEERFVKAATSARMSVKDDFVSVKFTCPRAEGTEFCREALSMWRGDLVEFFIRPSLKSADYLHYSVNVDGKTHAEKMMNGSPASGFKSRFTNSVKDLADGGVEVSMKIPRSEVFAAMPEEGDVFTAQFIREGSTCGGVSSWQSAGSSFHDVNTFGRIVYGSAGKYFSRRLSAVRSDIASRFVDPKAREAADAAVAPVAEAIAKHADNIAAFPALETMFANLDRALLQVELAGKKSLVYRPSDPWGNLIEADSLTRPLEKVSITVARGTKFWYPLAVANLSDRPCICEVKVVDKPLGKFGNGIAASTPGGLSEHFRAWECFPVYSQSQKAAWDAFAPLPVNMVLRVAPRGTGFVWLQLDTHGIEPGRHYATLVVKGCAPGFATDVFPVEVDVKDVDISDSHVDRSQYGSYVRHPDVNGGSLVKYLVDRDFNVIFMNAPGQKHLRIYNERRRDGTISKGDMTDLDKIIDLHLKFGMEKERVKVWFFLAFDIGWSPKNAGKRFSKEWTEVFKVWLDQLYAHLGEKYGITEDRVILYPYDEPAGDIDDENSKMHKVLVAAETIKSINPKARVFYNPLPSTKDADWRKALKRLDGLCDTLELYRGAITPERVKFVKSLGYKKIWTYSIESKFSHPTGYRRDYWSNLRDGFDGCTVFWHFDSMAGDDPFDPNASSNGKHFSDYGANYTDYGSGSALPSRRQIAADMGFEEARLVKALRDRAEGNPALASRIDEIVKDAADTGNMEAMDAAREALLAIAPKDRTIFFAGDSTLRSRKYLLEKECPEFEKCLGSWCDVLEKSLRPGFRIDNHAYSGCSTKSFIDSGRWAKLISRVKPGDFVYIQFGHDDQKKQPELHAAVDGAYRENLIRFRDEVVARGGHPIFGTSMVRRFFNADGTVDDKLEGYPEAVRRLGRELGVPVVDFNAFSRKLVEKTPRETSLAWYRAIVDKEDMTNLTKEGARVMASEFLKCISAGKCELSKCFR